MRAFLWPQKQSSLLACHLAWCLTFLVPPLLRLMEVSPQQYSVLCIEGKSLFSHFLGDLCGLKMVASCQLPSFLVFSSQALASLAVHSPCPPLLMAHLSSPWPGAAPWA